MLTRKMTVVTFCLAACFCWAFATTIADQPSRDIKNVSDSTASIAPLTMSPQAGSSQLQVRPGADQQPIESNEARHYSGLRGGMPIEEFPIAPSRGIIETPRGGDGQRSEPAACVVTPCDVVIYENANIAFITTFGDGTRPGHRIADDLNMSGLERFACNIRTAIFGSNNSGATVPVTMRILRGNLTPDCPGNCSNGNAACELFSATQTVQLNNPGRYVTWIPPTPFLIDEFVWIEWSTPLDTNTDVCVGIDGAAETGFTDNIFYRSQLPGCDFPSDNFRTFGGGDPYAGLDVRIKANAGAPGACCDRDPATATCATGIIRQDCVAGSLTKTWNASNTCSPYPGGCDHCMTDAECVAAGVPEGEPDCYSGYSDTTNDGCNSTPTACAGGGAGPCFTPISCGAVICGTSGRFKHACASTNDCGPGVTCAQDGAGLPFYCHGAVDDDTDDDSYQFVLTTETKVIVTLTPRFRARLFLMNNGGSTSVCTTTQFYDRVIAQPCETVTITRCLPEGTYRLLVVTDVFGIPCGSKYKLTLNCATCDSPLVRGACCDGTPCSFLDSVTCAGRGGLYRGDGVSCTGLNPPCPGVPSNDLCANALVLTGGTTGSGAVYVDTTFATATDVLPQIAQCAWEPAPPGTGTPMFRDVYFNYSVPTSYNGTAVTNGRLVLGTLGSTFDTYMVVYGDTGSGGACNSLLCSKPQIACSQNIVPTPPWPGPGRGGPRNRVSHIELTIGSHNDQPPHIAPGDCILIRCGSPDSTIAGRGTLRLGYDFVPTSTPFGAETGRCCYPDGTCLIQNSFTACENSGGASGAPIQHTDYYFGVNPLPNGQLIEEYAGCNANGCPKPGEAAYAALDLNAILGGNYGTTTRLTHEQLYYKYTLPGPSGGGVVFDTCGSSGFDGGYETQLSAYTKGATNHANCPILCGLGTLLITNDNCVNTEAGSDGALQSASCYSGLNGTFQSCLCLGVGSRPELNVGQEIIIVIGAPTDAIENLGSTRVSVDPVPDDTTNFIANNGQGLLSSLKVTQVSTCFTCPSPCPGGALQEGGPLCADTNESQPIDDWNGGCDATPPAFNSPTITCGTTPVQICGHYGNFKHPYSCLTANDCPNSSPCVNHACTSLQLFFDRDEDWYKVIVPQPGTISWKMVSGQTGTDLFIIADPPIITDPTASPCNAAQLTTLASGATAFGCSAPSGTNATLEITASVCAGTYYVMVTPDVFGGLGETDCSASYVCEVSCQPFVQLATCCVGDVNTDGKINGLDIQKWINLALVPPTVFDKFRGCFTPNFCQADINLDGLINLGDVSGLVSLLLSGPNCPGYDNTASGHCYDPARGQLPAQLDISSSDLDSNSNTRSADSFVPTQNGTITNLCWWGAYVTSDNANAAIDPDCFVVTIYQSGGSGQPCPARVPGSELNPPSSEPVVVTRTFVGVIANSFNEFLYEATLPTPIAVTKGNCYWLEIVNRTPGGGDNNSVWYWETSLQGDTRAAHHVGGTGLPTTYVCPDDIIQKDLAFSLNILIDKEGCGKPTGRCCYGLSNLCAITKEDICNFVNHGQWTENGTCGPANPACTVGRCCYCSGTNCSSTLCAITVQPTCESVGGRWTVGGDCTGSPACPIGRCCIPDPNNAGQSFCTAGTTDPQCASLGGQWLQGGDCLVPCPTAICNQNTSPDRCQTRDKLGGYASDVDKGSTVAENFRTTGFTNLLVSQLCWRGIHRTGQPTYADCDSGLGATGESFQITYYRNNGGLPGTVLAGPFTPAVLRTDTGEVSNPDGVSTTTIPIYQYEATHTAVAVSSGACYWIEIKQTNNDPTCTWYWASSGDGDNRSALKIGANPYRVLQRDFAICMGPVALTQPPPAACGGVVPAPSNDTCAGIITVTTGVDISGTTAGAAVEGGSASCGSSNVGTSPGDVWYHYDNVNSPTSNNKLDIVMCGAQTTFPAVVSLDQGVSPGFVPPCPGQAANEVGGVLSPACAPALVPPQSCIAGDLVYMGFGLPGKLVNVTVVNNRGYTIRVAGSQGTRGDFTMRLTKH